MRLLNNIRNILAQGLEYLLTGINFIVRTKDSYISPKARIRGASIYGNVHIQEGCKIIGGVTIKTTSSITIGRYTSLNGPNTDVISQFFPVNIGSFTSIARNVSIQEFNHNYNTITTYHIMQNVFGENKKKDIYSNGPIEIGNDVWIGTQCVILSGAKINDGVIVAANSVVTGEIPPYAIVAGSPAKVIKYRFDEDIIDLLLKAKWWEWSLDKIQYNRQLFEGKLSKEKLLAVLQREEI